MANKTGRRKFRVPLKEGASLPCSQASSASGLAEVSHPQTEREKESSQSWLSQLSVKADVSPSSNKTTSAKFSTAKPTQTKELEVPTHETVRSKGGHGIFSLDDSLCSIGVENENSSNSGDSASVVTQDSLSGSSAIASPGELLHQGTQTHGHTVLSFCSEISTPAPVSELRKEVSAAIGKFQVIEYALDEPTDNIIVDSEDEAMEMEQGNLKDPGESRFQRKSKPATRRYDYSKILPRFGPQKGKKGLSKNTKTVTKKRVTLDLVVNTCGFSKTSASAAVSDAGHHDATAKGDLSVYDYQPTPQQEGREGGGVETTSELNNSNWISKRTREEQLAVDREVLKIIAKTREEICILRETYAARKASRKNSLQFGTESLNRHVFKVPQEGFRRSRRVKPSLVMREDHYYSSPRHKDAYGTVHNYATLEKREE